jgi:hypothetical protein
MREEILQNGVCCYPNITQYFDNFHYSWRWWDKNLWWWDENLWHTFIIRGTSLDCFSWFEKSILETSMTAPLTPHCPPLSSRLKHIYERPGWFFEWDSCESLSFTFIHRHIMPPVSLSHGACFRGITIVYNRYDVTRKDKDPPQMAEMLRESWRCHAKGLRCYAKVEDATRKLKMLRESWRCHAKGSKNPFA